MWFTAKSRGSFRRIIHNEKVCTRVKKERERERMARISAQFHEVSISRPRSVYFLVSTTASDRIEDWRKSRLWKIKRHRRPGSNAVLVSGFSVGGELPERVPSFSLLHSPSPSSFCPVFLFCFFSFSTCSCLSSYFNLPVPFVEPICFSPLSLSLSLSLSFTLSFYTVPPCLYRLCNRP